MLICQSVFFIMIICSYYYYIVFFRIKKQPTVNYYLKENLVWINTNVYISKVEENVLFDRNVFIKTNKPQNHRYILYFLAGIIVQVRALQYSKTGLKCYYSRKNDDFVTSPSEKGVATAWVSIVSKDKNTGMFPESSPRGNPLRITNLLYLFSI